MMSRIGLTHRRFYRSAVPVLDSTLLLTYPKHETCHKSVQEFKYNFLSTWSPWIKHSMDTYVVLIVEGRLTGHWIYG